MARMKPAGHPAGLRTLAALLVAAICLGAAPRAWADAGWFESGDLALRLDLQLLNDASVIRLPISHWPLPRAAVEHAVGEAKEHHATNAAVSLALERVRARLAPRQTRGPRFDAAVSGGEAGRLRSFDAIARETAELTARAAIDGDRFAATLALTGAADPADGETIRADGSHATLRLGNWLVSASTLERWWGPGYDGGLILSNNARPMPTFMIERAAAKPFAWPVLDLLGPWRFSLGVSRMETERADIDSPLFLAWRVSIMPTRKIELGLTRTAQFCGEQLPCSASSIRDMLIGNDNPGFDATAETEPGNQMAGFDIRWLSPIGDKPYAVYSQMIGEDESGYLPVKYLEMFGLEVWRPRPLGDSVHGFLEYTDNTCSASRAQPRFDCAYMQTQFNVEGYRYRGRTMGHSADNDAEIYTLGLAYSSLKGELWSLKARTGALNRGGFAPDGRNTVSAVPADYDSIEAGWRGKMLGGKVSAEVGVESYQPDGADRDIQPFGFLRWQFEFAP